jgi:hypothetical protein
MTVRKTQAKVQAARGIRALARLGFTALGVVYLIVAGLAVQVAVGVGGKTTDPRGAIATMMQAPFGRVLLVLVAVGLAGYALWRFVEAVLAPEGEKPTQRLAAGVKGAAYASLAAFSAHLAYPRVPAGGGGGGTETRVDTTTGWLMHQPFGRWLVVAVGIGAIGWGLYQAYTAWKGKEPEPLAYDEMPPAQQTWVQRFAKFGLGALGLVSVLVGIFLALAGLHARPQEARGLAGSLGALTAQPFGHAALAALALGLAAYGAYNLMVARYRRFGPVLR